LHPTHFCFPDNQHCCLHFSISHTHEFYRFARCYKAISVLDAILSPEWEYHFYAYNSQWSENEEFCKSYQVTSIPFTSFLEEEHYHLIIQRQKRKDAQSNL